MCALSGVKWIRRTVFNDGARRPGEGIRRSGFEWLHLVDLNGAFEGQPVNAAAVREPEGGRRAGPARRRHPHLESIEHWLNRASSGSSWAPSRSSEPGLVQGRLQAVARPYRGRHRCARRHRRGRRLGQDEHGRGARSRAAVRGRRRLRDHLHRHRPRRRHGRRQCRRDGRRSPSTLTTPVIASGGVLRSTTCASLQARQELRHRRRHRRPRAL